MAKIKGAPTHFKYGVICDENCNANNHNIVELSEQEYMRQLNKPDSTWQCPICKAGADWDDESFVSA